MNNIKIAVLAVQGAFAEHEKMLEEMGCTAVELRCRKDLQQSFDGIVLPGGESTVQGKLLRELNMFEEIKHLIENGLPVLATCAGLILLSKDISNDERRYFATLPVKVKRNAYGRQLGSFHHDGNVKGIGDFPMEFIRAPYIDEVYEEVEVLSEVDNHTVAVKYKNQLAMAFHPELTGDTRLHSMFIKMCKNEYKN